MIVAAGSPGEKDRRIVTTEYRGVANKKRTALLKPMGDREGRSSRAITTIWPGPRATLWGHQTAHRVGGRSRGWSHHPAVRGLPKGYKGGKHFPDVR